jgi:hypothetical protein
MLIIGDFLFLNTSFIEKEGRDFVNCMYNLG